MNFRREDWIAIGLVAGVLVGLPCLVVLLRHMELL